MAVMEAGGKLLEKLSQLSALRLSDREKAEIKGYLQETLSYFESIKNIDTKGVKPLVSPLSPPLALRADEPEDFPDKDKLLDQAPQKRGALVKAPPAV